MKSDIVTTLPVARPPDAGTPAPASQDPAGADFGRTLDAWRGQMAAQGVRADRTRTLEAARTAAAEPARKPAPDTPPRDASAATATAARDARRLDERAQQTRREAAARAEPRDARPAKADPARDAADATDAARAPAAAGQAGPQDEGAAPTQATDTAGVEPVRGKGRGRAGETNDPIVLGDAGALPTSMLPTPTAPAPAAMPVTLQTEGSAPAGGARHGLPKAAGLGDGAGRGAAAELRAALPSADAGTGATPAATEVSTRDFAALLGREQRRQDGGPSDLPIGMAPMAAPVAPGIAPAVAGTTPVAAPVTEYTIAAPVGSDGFAPGLKETVSMVIADGLESAQIEINPPDMGPVKIELSLDGTDARMVFTAAQPETRQAIEQSAPLLRSMLSEQGLSLSGFDVGAGRQFDQRGRDTQTAQNGGAASPGNGASGTGGTDAPLAGLPRSGTRVRGLLDLFA